MNLLAQNSAYVVTIPEMVPWAIFAGILFLFLVMSVIFMYHWNRYGGKNMIVLVGGSVYFIGAILFIGIALAALVSIS